MDESQDNESSGPSSLSSDQASLCVIPDPYDSFEEDGFIYLDKSSLPASLNTSEQERTVIVFHSIDEEYAADKCILCQYIRPEGWQESVQDGISLFKVGWVTIAESSAYVAVPEPLNVSDPIGRVIFPADSLPKDTTNLYQFCYMRDSILLGASTPFQFKLSNSNDTAQDGGSKGAQDDGKFDELHNVSYLEEENHFERVLKQLSSAPQSLKPSVCTKPEEGLSSSSVEKAEGRKPSTGAQKCDESSLIDEKLTSILRRRGLLNNDSSVCSLEQESVIKSCMEIPNYQVASMKEFHHDLDDLDSLSDMTWSHGSLALRDSTGSRITEFFNDLESLSCKEMQAEIKEECIKNTKTETTHTVQEKEFSEQHFKDELSFLKQRLQEVTKEKEWFQGQYNSCLINMKKFADDLSVERTEKESLNGHMAELMISHKMLCSENTRLNKELEKIKQIHQEHSAEREPLIEKTVIQKQVGKDSRNSSQCKCENYKSQLNDLTARLSAYEVMRNCLEVELEEEIKLGLERDDYVARLEKQRLHELQISNNWLASTPNANPSLNGNTLLEMEENVNTTIEALECSLKEIEVLRSRKAAINRANRALREQFMLKREEWESQLNKQRAELNIHLTNVQAQLDLERAMRLSFEKEVESLNEKLQQQITRKESDYEADQTSNKEICEFQSYPSREVSNLSQKDLNCTLLKNLEEARDEYKKLYSEKMRIQLKFEKLQQKVRSKKNSRIHQDIPLPETSYASSSDFVENVTATWRAIVDELM